MSDLFIEATKLKLRFDTPQGQISTEDLWDIPLTSNRKCANLDDIAIGLDKQLKEYSTTSFVKKTKKSNDLLKLKFDIVLTVIKAKQEEEEISEQKVVNKEKKQKLLEIIAHKENEAMASKSIEELMALVNDL
jgi:hypothetical protein